MTFVWPDHDRYKLLKDDDLILDSNGMVWIRGQTVVTWLDGSERLLNKEILSNRSYKASIGDILRLPSGWDTSVRRNELMAPFLSIRGILMLVSKTSNSDSLNTWLLEAFLPAVEAGYHKHLLVQLSRGVCAAVPKVWSSS